MPETAGTPLPVAVPDGPGTCAATGKPCRCGKTPRPRSRRRLSSIHNVKTALADILWMLEQHQVEPGHARALIHGYSVLAGAITGSDDGAAHRRTGREAHMKFVGFRGTSQRVKDLEREASPKSIGYVVVTNPRTEEQTERIARLQAEGNEVRLVADPYQRPEPPRAA